ncbi:MAG TPA: outer membrane protein assembly factor BamE [Verrucomicrobiae bacterium]|nr:outer membrane protein assembly factor BamE [Verrucomicrobiae bacterium]
MRGIVVAVLLAACVCGCSRLTRENYEKLKVGMTFEEVTTILGKPTSCSDAMIARSCVWGDERRNITVNFLGKQVILHTAVNIR